MRTCPYCGSVMKYTTTYTTNNVDKHVKVTGYWSCPSCVYITSDKDRSGLSSIMVADRYKLYDAISNTLK